MAKLTERQKKNIVSAYAAGGVTFVSLAKKYDVSIETIRRIIKKDSKFVKKCEAIKKEAEEEAARQLTQTILDRRHIADELLDDILRSAKGKITEAPLRDLMGAAKILKENFLPEAEAASEASTGLRVVICDNGLEN